MKQFIKYISARIYKPLLLRYLSKTRTYHSRGIRVLVHPEVFHPGFFFSTKLLLRHISRFSLTGKSFLELGAGSGLISMFAAKHGAKVTATDINPRSVEYLQMNSSSNKSGLHVIQSDLFCNIPAQAFDIIAINPPYYRRQPQNNAEYAWYCGENGEYFTGLFSSLLHYTHPLSETWMVLCEDCDLTMIKQIARRYHWGLYCVRTSYSLGGKDFIFKIERH